MTHSPSFWKELRFVTGNAGKVAEASRILDVDLEPVAIELEEIQTCDVEIAVKHKVNSAYEKLQCPVLVEDSGLILSAWNGLPGALIKWFEETVGLKGMLKMLEGFESREAIAVCRVAVHDGTKTTIGRGEVKGVIASGLRGKQGFGWDAIFIPDGFDKTFGEMAPEEKNSLSHRKRAFEDLKKLL